MDGPVSSSRLSSVARQTSATGRKAVSPVPSEAEKEEVEEAKTDEGLGQSPPAALQSLLNQMKADDPGGRAAELSMIRGWYRRWSQRW